jgi:hypothetical protein
VVVFTACLTLAQLFGGILIYVARALACPFGIPVSAKGGIIMRIGPGAPRRQPDSSTVEQVALAATAQQCTRCFSHTLSRRPTRLCPTGSIGKAAQEEAPNKLLADSRGCADRAIRGRAAPCALAADWCPVESRAQVQHQDLERGYGVKNGGVRSARYLLKEEVCCYHSVLVRKQSYLHSSRRGTWGPAPSWWTSTLCRTTSSSVSRPGPFRALTSPRAA